MAPQSPDIAQVYAYLAANLNLEYDQARNLISGKWGDFDLLLFGGKSPFALTAQLSAQRMGGYPLTADECKQFKKAHSGVQSLSQEGTSICLAWKNTPDPSALLQLVGSSLADLTGFLSRSNFRNCCQLCQRPGETSPYQMGYGYGNLCPDCGARAAQPQYAQPQYAQAQTAQPQYAQPQYTQPQYAQPAAQNVPKKATERVALGILGALLGSILGAAVQLLLGRLGIVSALSGLAMAFFTLSGYRLLGKRLSAKGIVIGVVLMLLMVYLADRLDWAIILAQEFGTPETTLLDWFLYMPQMISQGYIEMSNYLISLGQVYLFAVIGAVPTILGMRPRKEVNKTGAAAANQQFTPDQYGAPHQQYTPDQYGAPNQQYTPDQYGAPNQQYTPSQYGAPNSYGNQPQQSGSYSSSQSGSYPYDGPQQ